ncbi:hypothetical protein HYV86_02055 [Candidatus Woesearchaeota archaeon]|nr:hypothetical protein [Candidatus Woesearchaeota archaeon]
MAIISDSFNVRLIENLGLNDTNCPVRAYNQGITFVGQSIDFAAGVAYGCQVKLGRYEGQLLTLSFGIQLVYPALPQQSRISQDSHPLDNFKLDESGYVAFLVGDVTHPKINTILAYLTDEKNVTYRVSPLGGKDMRRQIGEDLHHAITDGLPTPLLWRSRGSVPTLESKLTRFCKNLQAEEAASVL